jgi:heterodisulfide reductase subunit C
MSLGFTNSKTEDQWRQAFYRLPAGKKILNCIQCGTCSASCPLTDHMDHAPRELFALLRDGASEEVLQSNTPWFCVSCYQCMVRCPQQIPVTDIMYLLKQMAAERGLAPAGHKLPDLYQAFAREIEAHGRVSESLVMARYGVRHPLDMLGKAGLGLKLFVRRRLELIPRNIHNRTNMTMRANRPECKKKS